MRSRLSLILVVGFSLLPCIARAQGASQDPMSDGMVPGDYLRVSGGSVSPINPQGSLRDWSRGSNFAVTWDNWQPGGNGLGRVGFGLGIGYTLLPLNESRFLNDFAPVSGGLATSATAASAGIIEITTNVRIRIPAPFIMPSVSLGFGFMDWRPSEVHYTATSGAGTAQQQHRSGAELSIGGGLDKTVYDRFGVFAEALYVYGFTSFGQGLATPTGTCATATGCDVLKNTSVGTLRGGLRVRVGR